MFPQVPLAGAGVKAELGSSGDGRHWQFLCGIVTWVQSIAVEAVVPITAVFSAASVNEIFYRHVLLTESLDVTLPLRCMQKDTRQIKHSPWKKKQTQKSALCDQNRKG